MVVYMKEMFIHPCSAQNFARRATGSRPVGHTQTVYYGSSLHHQVYGKKIYLRRNIPYCMKHLFTERLEET